MKKFLSLMFALAALAVATSAAENTADAAWKELQDIAAEQPENLAQLRMDQRERWRSDQSGRYAERALAFLEKYPTDPRRWVAVSHMLQQPRIILKASSSGSELTLDASEIDRLRAFSTAVDREAMAAWLLKMKALSAAMAAAPDATEEQRALVASQELNDFFSTGGKGLSNSELIAYWEKIESFATNYPQSPITRSLATRYLSLVSYFDSANVQPALKLMAASSNAGVREFVALKLQAIKMMKTPVDLKFTALDGREVDLAKLRGKVVLVDFWATWCVPCVAELPNVKKVYAAYHDQGFEVVGISLDREKDRQKLIDFTKENAMPWPQHYDGKYAQNEIAVRFAIDAIPAMLLIGTDGLIVSTNARGAALENEVRRLLKL